MLHNMKKNWVTIKRGEVFRSLNSDPKSWKYVGGCRYETSKCELCETDILWRYSLTNKETKQILLVGSECIKWYYEVYMPNGLHRAIELLNKSTNQLRKQLVAEKLEKFANSHPYVYNVLLGNEAYRYSKLLCNIYIKNTYQPLRSVFRIQYPHNIFEEKWIPMRKFRQSLRRKGYLHKHEILTLLSGLNNACRGIVIFNSFMEKYNKGNIINE